MGKSFGPFKKSIFPKELVSHYLNNGGQSDILMQCSILDHNKKRAILDEQTYDNLKAKSQSYADRFHKVESNNQELYVSNQWDIDTLREFIRWVKNVLSFDVSPKI